MVSGSLNLASGLLCHVSIILFAPAIVGIFCLYTLLVSHHTDSSCIFQYSGYWVSPLCQLLIFLQCAHNTEGKIGECKHPILLQTSISLIVIAKSLHNPIPSAPCDFQPLISYHACFTSSLHQEGNFRPHWQRCLLHPLDSHPKIENPSAVAPVSFDPEDPYPSSRPY